LGWEFMSLLFIIVANFCRFAPKKIKAWQHDKGFYFLNDLNLPDFMIIYTYIFIYDLKKINYLHSDDIEKLEGK